MLRSFNRQSGAASEELQNLDEIRPQSGDIEGLQNLDENRPQTDIERLQNLDENQHETDNILRDDVSFSGLVTYMRKNF